MVKLNKYVHTPKRQFSVVHQKFYAPDLKPYFDMWSNRVCKLISAGSTGRDAKMGRVDTFMDPRPETSTLVKNTSPQMVAFPLLNP